MKKMVGKTADRDYPWGARSLPQVRHALQGSWRPMRTMLNSRHTSRTGSLPHSTMKITLRLPHAMSLLLLLSTLLHSTPAVWAQSPTVPAVMAGKPMRAGIAKVVGGEVRVLGTQGMRTLEPGDAVFSGDRLVTGRYGLTSVVLRDGTTLVLGNNSQLHIQTFAFDATTADGNILLELLQGSIRVLTGLISKINPDAVQVKTSTLLVGVRGTDFIVEAEEPSPLAFSIPFSIPFSLPFSLPF
jgi:hypothetical protein